MKVLSLVFLVSSVVLFVQIDARNNIPERFKNNLFVRVNFQNSKNLCCGDCAKLKSKPLCPVSPPSRRRKDCPVSPCARCARLAR